jgi:hypothetical protein
MALNYSLLAQYRVPNTIPVSIYQSGTGETVQLFIKIANVSSAAATVRIFHSNAGSTYDETTAIAWDVKIQPGDFLEVDHIFVDNPSGNIAYRSSVANALTATVYGVVRV